MSLKVKIDNIEKYATALNNLIGADSAYFTGDENARNVAELSFCIDTDINKKLLKRRFDFLIEQNI